MSNVTSQMFDNQLNLFWLIDHFIEYNIVLAYSITNWLLFDVGMIGLLKRKYNFVCILLVVIYYCIVLYCIVLYCIVLYCFDLLFWMHCASQKCIWCEFLEISQSCICARINNYNLFFYKKSNINYCYIFKTKSNINKTCMNNSNK